jgi:hypothetical protein
MKNRPRLELMLLKQLWANKGNTIFEIMEKEAVHR